MPNFTMPTSGRQHFIAHAPRRPRAADQYSKGVHTMSKRAALDCAHMQLQPPDMRASIAIDLDSIAAYSHAREMDYPQPQLLMVNPANEHLHAIWQFSDPVPFGENARPAPQRAFMDLQRQITLMYGADTAYSHYMVKTPGHPRWETVETGQKLYTLAGLLDAIPSGIQRQASERRERPVEGEGRHQTLWNIGRQWAYRHAKRAKQTGSFEAWQDRVLVEFQTLNSFAQPLGFSQVRSLARNVARWTWQHADSLNGSVLDGEKRSLTKSWEREAITPEQATERRSQGAMYTNAVRRNRMHGRITAAIGELAGQGIHSPTQGQIAQAAGVSRQAVNAYMQREGPAGRGN